MIWKKYIIIITVMIGIIIIDSCKESFLDIIPNEIVTDASLALTYEGVDQTLIGAYAMLDGADAGIDGAHPTTGLWYNMWSSSTTGWVFSSIRGLEATRGSGGSDQNQFHVIGTFDEGPEGADPGGTETILCEKWIVTYEGIARCNASILTARRAEAEGTITQDESMIFIRQARALRGFYHLEAWRMWADMNSHLYVPYVDEYTDFDNLTNTEDIRSKIIEDLTEGTMLPNNMKQVGRFNKTVSQCLLAKAYMQMYRDYSSALPILADVELNGTNPAGQKVGLEHCYGDIFDIENRNGVESIYTVQTSVNDGSEGWNGGWGTVMNFPLRGPATCCGFFQPTQDFVNTFRTDANGLPYLDTYNNEKVTNDQGLAPEDPFTEYTGRLDPRLDWSVGRRGIPYWDWGDHTGQDWITSQDEFGPYSPKKAVYKKSQEGIFTELSSWTYGYTANGYRLIRYADVLLLKAECEAMTGSDDFGMGEVNAVRARAANPDGFVKEEDGIANAANYVIGLYTASQFSNTTDAMKAIKFERRLELGQEGHRYWDLQRWGEVQPELNRILEYEKTMEWGSIFGNAYVGPEDVNYPLPQYPIETSNGNLVQNR
jgi:hypothetical protein